MSPNDERVRSLATQRAADFFIENRAGPSARERDAFAAWLRASPAHIEEYLAIAVIAHDLREASDEAHGALEELLARARLEESTPVEPIQPGIVPRAMAEPDEPASRRWQGAAVAAVAVAVAGFAALLLWRSFAPRPRAAAPIAVAVSHFETRHGEQRSERLADGSVLHLNTDSAVTVRLGPRERLVELATGEVAFEVIHESSRAFRVLAGAAEVVDLGTRFDVRLERASTVVTVADGRVAVGLSPGPDHPLQLVQLGANQQVTVAAGAWPAVPVAVDAQRSTAWMHRQISFDHEPLERVAQEFNRYSPKPIEITTPSLRELEISGVFSTDDTDAFVAFLRSLEGVHVEVTATRIRVSRD